MFTFSNDPRKMFGYREKIVKTNILSSILSYQNLLYVERRASLLQI